MRNYIIKFSILIISFISCNNNRNVILSLEVCGVISNIYQDKRNHEAFTFDVVSNQGTQNFIAGFYPSSWVYASIGDSIIKEKGDDFITIKKNSGSFQTFKTRIK